MADERSRASQIEALKALHDLGTLSDEEFIAATQRLAVPTGPPDPPPITQAAIEPPTPAPPPRKTVFLGLETWSAWLVGGIVVVLVLAVIGALIPEKAHTPSAQDLRYYGLTVCKPEVRKHLVAPSTAKFPDPFNEGTVVVTRNSADSFPDVDAFDVESWVDAENSFGAPIRMNFSCEVEHDLTRKTWTAVNASVSEPD